MGSGRFIQVLVEFTRDSRLSADALALGVVLAGYADRNGIAWPGLSRLQRELHISRHRVEAARALLATHGYIKILQTRGGRGRFAKVRYRITETLLHRAKS